MQQLSVSDPSEVGGGERGTIVRMSGRAVGLGFASVVLAASSFSIQTAEADSRPVTSGADSAVVGADGSVVGQVTTHKRGDGVQAPAELGNPAEWGVVTMRLDSSADSVRPFSEACVNASGGKWCYGWYTVTGGKYCYSNYFHATKGHSSSVKMHDRTYSSGWVKAADYSNAHHTAGLAYTCSTYYNVD